MRLHIDDSTFPLRAILLQPSAAVDLPLAAWDLLIQQARATGLLGRVAALLQETEVDAHIPAQVRWHLDSALTLYRAHCEDIRLEVAHVGKALAAAGLKTVLLKGAAYLAAGDRAMLGRLYSDVDIFVPRERIAAAEEVLRWQGWQYETLSEYDQTYYRRWMHELPPLTHRTRGITLDVHHNLLPLTSRIRLDADALATDVVPSQIDGVFTLSAPDRVLHSASHLLLNGDFDNAFRDLSDLRLLIDQMSTADEGFWGVLVSRAETLGVGRVLFYALRYLERLLALYVPPHVAQSLQHRAPSGYVLQAMDRLFTAALLPASVAGPPNRVATAKFTLFIRSHYLKMPLPLLVRHLGHKAFVTPFEKRAEGA